MSTTKQFPSVRVPDDVVVTDVSLARAITLHNELGRRVLLALFPSDLQPAEVAEHLTRHLEVTASARLQGVEARASRSAKSSASQKAVDAVDRLQRLVDAAWPAGTVQRADFFPAGPAHGPLVEQLRAFVNGIRKHKLALPPDLSVASLEALARTLGASAQELDRSLTQVGATRASRGELVTRTREIRDRLRDAVVGYFGKYSPELVSFGLTPRARHRKAKAAPRKAPVAPAPAPVITVQ